MRKVLALFLLLSLLPSASSACFGPKLYLGTGSDAKADVLYALVSLYIKEKTGTETVRVPLGGKDPFREIGEERIDLAFVTGGSGTMLLQVSGWPALASGKRPVEDLQFTTVPAALKKLNGLLRTTHLEGLLRQVQGGDSPAAAARRFLAAQKWI